MDLWIRSQDKRTLRRVLSLDINGLEIMTSNVLLGKYKTRERALEVLDEIQEYMCYDKWNYEDKYKSCYQDCKMYKSDIIMIYEMPE